jgi:hypothetical protein
MQFKPDVNKAQYSEAEVADQLGVTVEELRMLIRRYIVIEENEATSVPMATFQASDLLVLRLLVKNQLSTFA